MSDWWEAVEQELQRLGEAAPDPWGHMETAPAENSLTPEQRAFLTQLVEIPSNELDDDDFNDDV